MTHYGFRLALLFLGGLTVVIAGCGRAEFTFVPVEGTVTKGGRPLRGIEVVFLADLDAGTVGPRASGRTDESGHYRLRSDRGDDGAVAGKHLVLILDPEARKGRMGRAARGPQTPENVKRLRDQLKIAEQTRRVPSRYGRFNETPLRAEVRPGEQIIDLDVK